MASTPSCHEKQASSAVAGSPSDHFMPSRMWKVQDLPSAARSQLVGEAGDRLEVRAGVDQVVVGQAEGLVADDEERGVRVQRIEVLRRPDPEDDRIGRRDRRRAGEHQGGGQGPAPRTRARRARIGSRIRISSDRGP